MSNANTGRRKCTFHDCNAFHLAKGFCGGHYRQWSSGETIRPLVGKHIPADVRFWDRVSKTESCWLFRGPTVGIGHAVFKAFGETLAHRVAWVIHFGPISRGNGFHGTVVMHKCDVPNCVNPSHLMLGTQADNVADTVRKGRNSKGESASRAALAWTSVRRGENWHGAKLTNKQADEITFRRKQGEKTTDLAREFGVSQSLVSRITRGERRGR